METAAQKFENLYSELLSIPPEDFANEEVMVPLREKLIVAAEKASEQGHSNSLHWLGNDLYFGTWGSEINPEKGIELLTSAAQAGHLQAQLDLANILELDKMDYPTAYALYNTASKSGSMIAKVKMAEMAYYGRGIKTDPSVKEKSLISLAQMGEAQGSSLALYTLANIQENNFLLQDRDRIVYDLLEQGYALLPEDPESYAAESKVFFKLGKYVYEGIGTDQDQMLGLQYIQHAASLGDYDANLYLEQNISNES